MHWARAAVAFAVVWVVPLTLSAQQYDEGEIHFTYSYLNFDTNGVTSRQRANGWEAGVSGNLNQWFGVEFSLSGYYKTYTVPTFGELGFRDHSFAAGPRINFKQFFIHALLGGDLATTRVLGASHTQNGFGGAFGSGIQKKISGPWAARVSADYVFTRHKLSSSGPAYLQNNYRVTAGIAYIFRGHAEKELQPTSSSNTVSFAVFGVTVAPTKENSGAEIVDVTPGSVADRGGLRPGYIITSVNAKDVHTPMELVGALSGLSGKVQIGYNSKSPASGWVPNVTTVVFGQRD